MATDFVYKGWIPCVSSSLSFKYFGTARLPESAVGHSVGYGQNRMVFCFQRRPLKDGQVPGELHQRLFAKTTLFYFVAAGHVVPNANSDALVGYVYVFTRSANVGGTAWRDIRRRLNSRSAPLGYLQHLWTCPASEVAREWLAYEQELHQFLADQSCFYCRFEVGRSGIVTITSIPGTELALSHLENKAYFSADPAAKRREVDAVVAQVFYFLRDNCHAHQHHSETDDSLTSPRCVEFNGPAQHYPWQWLEETGHLLYRHVLDAKRSANVQAYHSSKGILAYLRALDRLLPPDRRLKYDYELLSESIDAKIGELDSWSTNRDRLFQKTIVSGLTLMGVVLASAALCPAPSSITVDPWLIALRDLVLGDFRRAVVLAIGVPVWLYVYDWGADALSAPVAEHTTWAAVRYLQAFPRWLTVLLALLVAIVFMVAMWLVMPRL